MNKKILSVVLGGTIALASVLAFAGCGHKHNYETSYQVADCNTEGYTLHTCKDCGYKYADEFIAPYGHSYRNYYHVEDSVQTVSYAATSNSESDPHYSLFTTLTEEQWQELQNVGDDLCVHKKCQFCNTVMSGERDIAFEEMMQEMMDKLIGAPLRSDTVDIGRYWYNLPSMVYKDGKYVPKSQLTPADLMDMLAGRQIYTANAVRTVAYAAPAAVDFIWDLIIPDSIIEIEDFGDDIAESVVYHVLERVSLSENLERIGKNAFNSTSIDSILIPQSLQSIGSNAFANCTDLKIVYFGGTEAEWNAIQIAEGNDLLINAPRYYYSATKPTVSGKFWHYVDGEPTKW